MPENTPSVIPFAEESAGAGGKLALRDLLLEARRSVHSLSNAAGLLRIAQIPQRFMRLGRSGQPELARARSRRSGGMAVQCRKQRSRQKIPVSGPPPKPEQQVLFVLRLARQD